MAELTLFKDVAIKTLIIGVDSRGNNRVVGLISLNENVGSI